MGALQKKSFWSRPEGFTGVIFLGIAAVVGYNLAVLLWPLLVSGMVAGAVGAGILGTLGLFTRKKPRTLLGNIFRMSAYHLTGLLIPLGPIAILKAQVKDWKKQLAEAVAGIAEIRGVRGLLVSELQENVDEERELIDLAKKAGKKGDKLRMASFGRRAQMLEEQRKRFTVLLKRVDKALKALMRIHRVAHIRVEEAEFEVKTREKEYKIAQKSRSVVKKMTGLIEGMGDSELYDRTIQYIEDQSYLGEAEIEVLDDLTSDLYASVKARDEAAIERITALIEAEESRVMGSASAKQLARLSEVEEVVEDEFELEYPGQDLEVDALLQEFDEVEVGRGW